MVCHRFCPQALAEALKVNATVTSIDLRGGMRDEGAKAWCLARGTNVGGQDLGGFLCWTGAGPVDASRSL